MLKISPGQPEQQESEILTGMFFFFFNETGVIFKTVYINKTNFLKMYAVPLQENNQWQCRVKQSYLMTILH